MPARPALRMVRLPVPQRMPGKRDQVRCFRLFLCRPEHQRIRLRRLWYDLFIRTPRGDLLPGSLHKSRDRSHQLRSVRACMSPRPGLLCRDLRRSSSKPLQV
jgi:hypothetical protein